MSSAHSLGQILGPTFAGFLVGWHLLSPLFAITLMTSVALLLVWRLLPHTTTRRDTAGNGKHPRSNQLRVKPYAPALIAMNISVFLGLAMMQTSLAFLLIDTHHLTPTAAAQSVGLAMMVSAISALTVQVALVQRTALASHSLIKIALPLLALGYFIIFAHTAQYQVYIAMIFLGTGAGINYPSIAALTSSTGKPEMQATYMGLVTASPAMGYILGPPLAALLYSISGRAPFLASALLLTAIASFAAVHLRTRKVSP